MEEQTYPFHNIPLRYGYSGLEPYIDTKTMQLHHDKHLQTYIDNLNKALENAAVLQNLTLEELLRFAHGKTDAQSVAIWRNAGGVYNHFFWFDSLRPGVSQIQIGLSGRLLQMIQRDFGSLDSFKEKFNAAALAVFGSGYAWLVIDPAGKLQIIQTANQDTPVTLGLFPLLNIDVWEHAYYLKHYNVRVDYINAFWNVVDWVKVSARLEEFCRSNENCVG